MSDPISRIRELSKKVEDPRNSFEWSVPVEPSDLRYLLKCYDDLVAASTNARRTNAKDNYDMSGSEINNFDI